MAEIQEPLNSNWGWLYKYKYLGVEKYGHPVKGLSLLGLCKSGV